MKSGTLTILLLALFVSGNATAQADAGQGDNWTFEWYSLIKPLGIAALSGLCLTFLVGVFRRKFGRRFLKIHLALAFTTVVLGLLHGLLVLKLFGL